MGDTKKALATRSFSGGSGSVPSRGTITIAAAPRACSETVIGHAQPGPRIEVPARVAKRGRGAIVVVAMFDSCGSCRLSWPTSVAAMPDIDGCLLIHQ